MHAQIEAILQSPKLAIYQREINEVLAREAGLRQKFRDEVSESEKAEFINGEIIVHSPSRNAHNLTVAWLSGLLHVYIMSRPLGVVHIEKAMVTLTRNDYEPDICFWGSEKSDRFTPDQRLFPVPDFIAEVLSPSTSKNDRGIKFEDYAAHGVGEYWIIDADAKSVQQNVLQGDVYESRDAIASGNIASVAIPGFEIDVRAIFDKQQNIAAIERLMKKS